MNGDLPGPAARLAAASRDDPEGPGAWPQPVPPAATMRAVILPEFGPPDVLREETLPTPVPARGGTTARSG